MSWLRRSFITGFFVTVPLIISVAALFWIFQVVDGVTEPVSVRLLGRAVPPDVERLFVQRVLARGSVADVHDVKTRQLSTEDFQFKAEVRFSEPFVVRVLERALSERKELGDPAVLARFFQYCWTPHRLIDAIERLHHECKFTRLEANRLENAILDQVSRGGWRGNVWLQGETRHVAVQRADYKGRKAA